MEDGHVAWFRPAYALAAQGRWKLSDGSNGRARHTVGHRPRTTAGRGLQVCMVLALACMSCRTPGVEGAPQIVQPGAPGQASRTITAERAADLSKVQYTAADVRFMQGMIGHHAQALEMTALVASRSRSEDIRKLAHRIDVSQRDEIRMMEEWLKSRSQPLPNPHAHHAHGATLMPGMLNPDEMARLAASSGDAFDRLFLAFMIKHHEGALTMVDELFATPGAGQESEMFAFASDVDADQRMEIERMGAMLALLTSSKELER